MRSFAGMAPVQVAEAGTAAEATNSAVPAWECGQSGVEFLWFV
jgi:hypothetical protein